MNSSFATTYVELKLISCSLDYNGQNTAGGQVIIANRSLDLFGGHMENRQTPFIQVPAGTGSVVMNLESWNVNMTATTGTLDNFLNIAGTNNKVSIGNSITGSSGAIVPSLVNWSTAGTNNRLTVQRWHNQFQSNNVSLPVQGPGNLCSTTASR